MNKQQAQVLAHILCSGLTGYMLGEGRPLLTAVVPMVALWIIGTMALRSLKSC